MISNKEAYTEFISNDRSVTNTVKKLIVKYALVEEEDSEALHFRYKSFLKTRESFRKWNDLQTWEDNIFYSSSRPTINSRKKRVSTETDSASLSLLTIPEKRNFSEDVIVDSRKPILECNLKTSRSKLSILVDHIKFLAERENITTKQLVALALELVSNDSHDRETSTVCKEIVEKGSYSCVLSKVSIANSAYLLDSLEIGATKYSELKRILKTEGEILPTYKVVSNFRKEISLAQDINIVKSPQEFPIGTCVPYHKLVMHTIERTLQICDPNNESQFPLHVTISDGLDGSGSHRIYNQVNIHPDLSKKSFILFGFKVITIQDKLGKNIFVNKFPNSPFCFRPVALVALKEDYNSEKFIMDSLINPETNQIIENGVTLPQGHVSFQILRSLFDTKMAGLLDGVGGASCHLCTATDSQINSIDWVRSGFPINRFISDSRMIFEEVDEEEFLKLPLINELELLINQLQIKIF